MRRLFAILLVKDQPGQGNLQSLGNPQKTQTFLPARSGEKWPPVPAEARVLAIYEPETWQDPQSTTADLCTPVDVAQRRYLLHCIGQRQGGMLAANRAFKGGLRLKLERVRRPKSPAAKEEFK